MSFIISIILYFVINSLVSSDIFKAEKVEFKVNFITQENFVQNETIHSENLANDNATISNETSNLNHWYIQIDKVSLTAPIQEGTSKEILDDYVGHFEESSKDLGNICLAAHNRGYKNNYFNRLKELQEGDEIKYTYKDIERTYIVTKHEIIQNTDWSNLEPTEENTITLITCVENEPEYRRCIQGIEKSIE